MSNNETIDKELNKSEESNNLSKIVAKHYNNLEEKGVNARKESRIYHMRNFNNWIKSVIIAEVLQKIREKRGFDCKINVLDIGCGKGGDLLKYRKGRIDHIICADIAETSVKQCEERYNDMKSNNSRNHNNRNHEKDIFSAEFVTADCTRERLKPKYCNENIEFDLVSIQFSFHYCFESLSQAKCMIRNASESLKDGGIFIGTTPDSQEIIRRLRKSGSNSFGNDVYSVKFDDEFTDENYKIPLFGAKYDFHLEGVVDCPEFLVYFPVFQQICEENGLKLIYRKTFGDLFLQNKDKRNERQLLNIMDALERYSTQSLVGNPDEDYKHVKQFIQNSSHDNDIRHIGTLSQSEWEAISIYIAFAFRKVSNTEANQSSNKRLKT